MKDIPFLPLFILVVAYSIGGWMISFSQGIWLAWIFMLAAPVTGALAWTLAEDDSLPAAGFMLLILSAALGGLFCLTGLWLLAVGLATLVILTFFLPVSSLIYGIFTHGVAIAIGIYISVPKDFPNALLLPLVVAIPSVITWAWAKLEMPPKLIERQQAFTILIGTAWLGVAAGCVTENLLRLAK